MLIVDDEQPLRRLLRLYLAKEGIHVLEASTGSEALSLLQQTEADVAIVDVMLPGLDGFELVRRIRQQSAMPIILLTARGEETNRVVGLEVGADDYVVKPFSMPEVVARVRAQLRRARGFAEMPATLRAGSVALDRTGRRCLMNGEPVELTRREFDLLAVLLAYPGRVYTREQLLETVWGSRFISAKTVDVHVAGLRRKFGPALEITALRGVGYRLDS